MLDAQARPSLDQHSERLTNALVMSRTCQPLGGTPMPDNGEGRPGGAVAVVRRAPFSDNPEVGVRGRQTRQRILDAALRAFGEQGYHGASIDRITKLAQCSRVSFYQYFADKEDV